MRYIVVGFGKFGAIAVERLQNSLSSPEIVVLETDSRKNLPATSDAVTTVNSDGVSFLTEAALIAADDIIVPMVPFHLAAAYLLASTEGLTEIPLPESLPALVPNPYVLGASSLCCSRADFLCPDNCPEGETCTITGEARDPLYNFLEKIEIPGFRVVVLTSFQILPGVGGYSFGDLIGIEQRIKYGHYLLATSCKCHAVITALRK